MDIDPKIDRPPLPDAARGYAIDDIPIQALVSQTALTNKVNRYQSDARRHLRVQAP